MATTYWVVFSYYDKPPTVHTMTAAHEIYESIGGTRSAKNFAEKVKTESGILMGIDDSDRFVRMTALLPTKEIPEGLRGVTTMQELE